MKRTEIVAKAKNIAIWLDGKWRGHEQGLLRKKVSKILAQPMDHQCIDADELFDMWIQKYPPRPEYGYDPLNSWKRAVNRTEELFKVKGMQQPVWDVLEAACGDGVTGYLLSCYGHNVLLNDLEDWRDERASALPFILGDLCTHLPISSGSFDLIYSYNSFEHIHRPDIAFEELLRLCKPGGYIVLEFGPLFASPWGMHIYRTIPIPYVQFLFSPAYLLEKLGDMGVWDLGRQLSAPQPLNRWRVTQFEALWSNANVDILHASRIVDLSHLNVILDNPSSFQGQDLTFDDLTTQALKVVLKRSDS